ncbi:hypothetical protein J4414_04400, partial [Candidatus Woesearchaeota archaeon]|nr:hypothetical protein [Candidatus Woesearchaeota archaeon]
MINETIKDIKSKKELKNLDNKFVEEKLNFYLKKHPLENKPFKQLKRSKKYRLMLKSIRKDLREIYGAFIKEKPSLNNLKEVLKTKKLNQTLEEHNQILKTHQSTSERLNNYKEIYKNIFKEIKPESILDLACGLNPLSFPYMGLEDVYYIASELNKEDCNFIKDYLDLIKVKNKVIPLNLTKDYEKLNKIKVDIAFLFKTLDSLEKIKRNISKDLLKNINSRYIAVSFAIKSLSGRKPIKERGWFYRILRELDLNFKTFETEN